MDRHSSACVANRCSRNVGVCEPLLLALADAYQRAIGLNDRPPLEKFLAEKDLFLKDEKFPDENKLYTD